MEDDQWLSSPKRSGGEPQRPTGGNSGSFQGQRPGAGRAPNGTGSTNAARPGGTHPSAGSGQSTSTNSGNARAQGPWRDDGWGQSDRAAPQQRRGPSGPINSGGSPSAGRGTNPGDARRKSGGLGGQSQGGRASGSWETDDGRWSGQGSARTSRSLSSSAGRPGQAGQAGRGQTGQWGTKARGWEDNDELEDTGWGMRNQPQRRSSSPMAAGGRSGKSAASKQPSSKGQTRGGAAKRGDWLMEPDKPIGSPSQTLRTRLLLVLLAAVIVLGAAVLFVPSARGRLLSYLPGRSGNTGAPAAATVATLTIQVNVPNATVSIDGQAAQKTTASQTAPFSSIAFPGMTAGQHNLNIQAANFAPFSGPITIGGSNATLTAWLAPTQDALTKLAQQLGTPAPQPDPGVAGDQYAAGKKAIGTLKISIKYALNGLSPSSFSSQLAQNGNTTSPFKPVTLTLAPTITFTNASGTTLATDSPQALPANQFGVQMTLSVDANGNPQLGTPTFLLNSNIKAQFPGKAGQDFLLYYTLASMIPTPANALTFTCVGAKDTTNFNPEDGLFLSEAGGAHFFYRWGLLWATNPAAFTMAPNAPHAAFGTNEFVTATKIETSANPSCGS